VLFINTAFENPVLWTGMKDASAESRKNKSDAETSSDLMIEKTYDLCHGEFSTWCYESSEILPFGPAPLHPRALG